MLQGLFGECTECEAAAWPFARTCPNCGADVHAGAPRAKIIAGVAIAIAFIVVVVGANRLWYRLTAWREANLARIQSAPALFGLPGPTAQPKPAEDFAWIAKAMADCDSEAGKHLDALYFLVVPLASADGDVQPGSLPPLGQIGDSVTLLASKDALAGLRNRTLTLYKGQFEFSIVEPTMNVSYNWKPATGVSEFVTQEAIAIKSFKPGLRIVGVDSDTAWATTPAPQRAACYWISALLRTSPLNY
jgi:hypothetical protein